MVKYYERRILFLPPKIRGKLHNKNQEEEGIWCIVGRFLRSLSYFVVNYFKIYKNRLLIAIIYLLCKCFKLNSSEINY